LERKLAIAVTQNTSKFLEASASESRVIFEKPVVARKI